MFLLHLPHLVVRQQFHNGIHSVDLIEARARPRVIVDDAASLQMGIDGDRSDVLEAPLLEFSAYLFLQQWLRMSVSSSMYLCLI